MIYIDYFKLPSSNEINSYFADTNVSPYPWTIFFENEFEWVICKDITILYGNNGSGKSTLLNLLAQRIDAQKDTDFFKDVFYCKNAQITPFDDFVKCIKLVMALDDSLEQMSLPKVRRLITSDDIFRIIDEKVKHNRRATLQIQEVRERQNRIIQDGKEFQLKSMADFDKLEEILEARKLSRKQYAKVYAPEKEKMQSNGETSLSFYSRVFESGGIYLLDEPENCLSPIFQIELIKIIQDSVRYFDCQFIICTHSPLILSLKNAIIYNLDLRPVISQKWTDLENIKIYYDFFKSHKNEFE